MRPSPVFVVSLVLCAAACGPSDSGTRSRGSSGGSSSAAGASASASGGNGSASSSSGASSASNGNGSSSSGNNGSTSSSGGLTPAQGCPLAAEDYCALIQRCSPFYVASLFGDLATCEQRTTVTCLLELGIPDIGYDVDTHVACLQALNEGTCEDWLTFAPVPACNYPNGTRADGASCAVARQCAGGACVGGGECGTCAAAAGLNELCDPDTPCEEGLVCHNSLCIRPVDIGGSCTADRPCRTGAYCNQSEVCAAERGLGATCSETAPCEFIAGLYCDGETSTCQAYQMADADESCSYVEGIWCSAGGYCRILSGPSGACIAAANDDESCNVTNGPACLWPATCTNGTCQLPEANGCN